MSLSKAVQQVLQGFLWEKLNIPEQTIPNVMDRLFEAIKQKKIYDLKLFTSFSDFETFLTSWYTRWMKHGPTLEYTIYDFLEDLIRNEYVDCFLHPPAILLVFNTPDLKEQLEEILASG